MVKGKKLPTKTYDEIKLAWQNIQVMDVRTKFKALRQIGFEVINSYNKNSTTLEQINLYIEILKSASQSQSFPQKLTRTLTKLIADKLELSGDQNAEIITKKSGSITVNSGVIMLGDPSVTVALPTTYLDKELVAIINTGKRFLFGTGGDGVFDIQLRIVTANEPVLTPKEYKFVEQSSQTAIINIPSGRIFVGDLGSVCDEATDFVLQVMPGNYKVAVMVFHIPNKFRSYYIVMNKTNEADHNNFERMDLLEY